MRPCGSAITRWRPHDDGGKGHAGARAAGGAGVCQRCAAAADQARGSAQEGRRVIRRRGRHTSRGAMSKHREVPPTLRSSPMTYEVIRARSLFHERELLAVEAESLSVDELKARAVS